MLAEVAVATLNAIPPNPQPKAPSKFFLDFVTESLDEADCPCIQDDEEIAPLEDKEPWNLYQTVETNFRPKRVCKTVSILS